MRWDLVIYTIVLSGLIFLAVDTNNHPDRYWFRDKADPLHDYYLVKMYGQSGYHVYPDNNLPKFGVEKVYEYRVKPDNVRFAFFIFDLVYYLGLVYLGLFVWWKWNVFGPMWKGLYNKLDKTLQEADNDDKSG